MDLSHLVSIGLYAAKRGPLKEADHAYFQKHGLEKALADIVDQLAKDKPADPFKFIAEAAAKLSKGGAAPAAAKPASPKAAPKAAPVKEEKKPKAEAKSPKAAPKAEAAAPGGAVDEAAVKAVGDAIRALKDKLKGEGLSGAKINVHPEVVALVGKLKTVKEGGGAAAAPAAAKAAPVAAAGPVDEAAIKAVGDDLRALKEKLKSEGVTGQKLNGHPDVAALVAKLAALKSGGGSPKAAPAPAPAAKKAAKKEAELALNPSKGGGVDLKKADDVPGWYEQVIKKAELIEAYPVKGCFILRPWAYKIWEQIQRWFDAEIKKLGVDNCYFPMFIPRCYIEKEEDHLSDFAPELAWVSKFGNQELDEPVAIRPTSETAMYAAYSNWVQSHRDLPIKLNQWCSVVRWEVKQTTPFLRTREFLWQEGHSAFANKPDAEKEVRQILELYALVYEYCLALPVVRGTKTKAETFPGADYTTTVEAFIPATGRAIQGATSHHLGQNFAKMFDISFQDPEDPAGKARAFAHQNSWGITQRTIGVMTMVHGDDKGLVLPPRVAGYQVVIVVVGLTAKSTDDEREKVNITANEYYMLLASAGLRVHLDDREGYSPGYKFNHWEMKGVPMRLELGPKDLEKAQFVMAKRNVLDQKAGKVVGNHSTLVQDVQKVLEDIHNEMYSSALKQRDDNLATVSQWKDFSPNLNQGKLVLIPFCGEKECEENVKEKSKEEAADVEVAGGLKMGAKSLCVPLEEHFHNGCPGKCLMPGCTSTVKVIKRTLFGRSY
jgi:bifunctional glutamyl/prolyl-tRNA synthetase